MLTVNTDNLTGTSGNDTFSSTLTFTGGALADSATLTAGDNISGGTGVDTLEIAISGADVDGAHVATPTLTGIEKVLVRNSESDAADNVTIDLSLTDSALTTIGTTASTTVNSDTKFDNVGQLVGVVMAGKGDLEVVFSAPAVSGTADSLTLTLNGSGDTATTPTFKVNGIETLSIESKTAANYVKLNETGTVLEKVVVTGDKALTLDADGATNTAITEIDASAATGKVSINASGLALNAVTVKGGAGSDDVFITDQTPAVSDDLKNVTGFETIGFTGATASLDAAIAGVSTFDLTGGTTALTFATGYTGDTTVNLTGAAGTSVTNAANVALTINANVADVTTGTTIAGGSGADVLNLKADSAGASTLTDVSGVETINIVANGTKTVNIVTVDGTVASGKTLTVNGSALTSSTATLTFDGSAETNGKFAITGGAGADTITGGAGADTLIGGAGNDSIVAGAGNDSIVAGAGNDTIDMAGNLTAADTIDGGDGTDTLIVSATVAAAAFANVSNIENVQITGNTGVSLDAAIGTGVTFDLTGASNQTLTLATGYTGATTVKIGGGDSDKIVNSANVDLTVTAVAAQLTAADTITGGTGTDIIKLTADNDGTGATLTSVTGVERIEVVANTTTATHDIKISMGANDSQIGANKTLTVDASALTNSGATLTFVGNAAETDGYLNIIGGAGNDSITGAGSGFDTIDGGAGNDTITLDALSATNVINGGDGTDTLVVNSSITSAAFFNGVTNVEVLKLTGNSAATLAAPISQTGITTIDLTGASAQTLNLNAGYTGATTVKIGGGDSDKIVNNANVDLTVTATAAELTAGDTITGGTGTDIIKLTADNDGTGATLTNVSKVEKIQVVAATTATHDIKISMGANDSQIATGKTLTVDASALTDSGATLTFVGNAAETDGYLDIIGGAGADTISGGGSSDTFTGGGGGDTFITQKHANKFTFDTITDFGTGDSIVFNVTAVAADAAPAAIGSKITLAAAAGFTDYLDVAASDTSADGSDGTDVPVVKWFQFDGDTYVVVDNSNEATFDVANDVVVKLTGLIDLSASTAGLTNAGELVTLAYVAV